jgi:hypothetical protein
MPVVFVHDGYRFHFYSNEGILAGLFILTCKKVH